MEQLTKIHGVGEVLAGKLLKVANQLGLKTYSEIINHPEIIEMLPKSALAWLKYKPHTNVPRAKLTKIVRILETVGIVAGSWRRGKERVNDLDLLLPAGSDWAKLIKCKLTPPWAEGAEHVSTFVEFAPRCFIQLDIFLYTDLPAHLLYSTGSKDFNKRMRHVAKAKGFLLNQHGLWRGEKKIPCKSEAEIFTELGMKWLEPHQREII